MVKPRVVGQLGMIRPRARVCILMREPADLAHVRLGLRRFSAPERKLEIWPPVRRPTVFPGRNAGVLDKLKSRSKFEHCFITQHWPLSGHAEAARDNFTPQFRVKSSQTNLSRGPSWSMMSCFCCANRPHMTDVLSLLDLGTLVLEQKT